MIGALKEKIRNSIGLKFVAALTAVISVLMIVGTIFVARMLMTGQYGALESHGLELGHYLGKAGTDALFMKDSAMIDSLVLDAVRSRDMLYTFVQDGSGAVLSSSFSSFKKFVISLKIMRNK
jgi:hypothetical protein